MTNPFGPSKEFIFKAAREAGEFVRGHIGVSGKATTDEVAVTLRLRLRGRN